MKRPAPSIENVPARSRVRRQPLALSLCAAVALLSALGAAACSGWRGPRSSFELVPADSFAAVAIDWRVVGRDTELKRVLKTGAVESLLRRLGLGGEETQELTVFSDPQNPQGGGLIVRGSYHPRDVLARLKGEGWAESAPGSRKIYTNGGDRCAALGESSIVCGSEGAVEGAFAAERDPRKSFAANPVARKMIDRLRRGRAPIVIVAAFPTQAQDMAAAALQVTSAALTFANLGALGGLLEKIGTARGFGCSLSRSGAALPVEMVADMRDEQAAGFVSGALNIMQKLALAAPRAGASQADLEQLRAIQSMSVNREGEVLSIKLTMSPRDFGAG